jgi:RNA polymerase sigma-70 factor (ECF subfamily)
VELTEAEEQQSHWSPKRLDQPETTRLTREVLEILPEAQRRTIEMFFFEGLTFAEISERRNEKFSNVRHHYYRGLEQLRSYLENGLEPKRARPSIVPLGEV